MNLDGLDISILAPAFFAGLIVLLTHVPLGAEVLKRGIIFIDLAVAQMAGLGVIVAYTLGWGEHGIKAQLAAVVSALLGAWLLSLLEKKYGQHQEALIGISFILAATAGILLMANNPHGGEHLQEMLIGQILWVEWLQLLPAAIISLLVLAIWMKFKQQLGSFGFYTLFAIAITVSVQLVGVYLVFASLIIPSLAASLCRGDRCQWIAYVVGIGGYAMGLVVSAMFDLPSGAVIVWCIAMIATGFAIFFPAKNNRVIS